MISFIVIGRNEGWKLSNCLKSIYTTIENNALIEYEVIYVDSKSTDDSLERAKMFELDKIIQLTEDFNSAIARNVGAMKSTGKVLFFIDGDMEIQSDFLPLVYSENSGLIDKFVSGNWVNFNYDNNNHLIKKDFFLVLKDDNFETVTGGLFLIKRDVWEMVGGMRAAFRRSQDLDLGLRLAKKKIFLLRKNHIAANHHTIAYMDSNRIWKDFFKFNTLYGRPFLYRVNLFNIFSLKRMIRNDYTFLILTISVFALIVEIYIIFVLYILLISIKGCIKVDNLKRVPEYFFYYFSRDLTTLIGFVFFHPQKLFNVGYKYFKNNSESFSEFRSFKMK